ncbi:MAG: hypothetical protein KDA91_13130 [Planctomycetaceae bacterium]|nr:hypothetical protein [Planctomycetaceae bacterium]
MTANFTPQSNVRHPASMACRPAYGRISQACYATSWVAAAILLFGHVCAPTCVAAEPAVAQDEEGFTLLQEGTRPLATITFASVERLLTEGEYIFDAAGQPDAFATIAKGANEFLDQLPGLDKSKPAGLMIYLPAIIPPIPEVFLFLPTADFEDVTRFTEKVLERAPVVGGKQAEEGRYEVVGPRRTWYVKMQGNYAIIPVGPNATPEMLDREIPAPDALLATQAQLYDVSITLDLASIPPLTRTLLTTVLTAGISSQMQQRDEEPDSAYQIRRAEGDRALAALQQILDECDRMIFALNVDAEEHAVNMDMVIDAKKGTKFFDEILESTTKPSYFIPLLDDSAAASFSMSSIINERDRNAYIRMLEGVKGEVVRVISENDLGPVPDENGPIGQALSGLQATLDAAHVDAFGQFYSDSEDKLAIVGALRLEQGDAIALGLTDLLGRLQDVAEVTEKFEITSAYGQHQGIVFHRLVPKQIPPMLSELFGRNPGLTFGAGDRTLWLALGGEPSYDTVTGVMDQLQHALENPQDRTSPANFRVIVNVNQLIEMQKRVAGAMSSDNGTTDDTPDQVVETSREDKPVLTNPSNTSGETPARSRSNSRRSQRRAIAGRIFTETMAEGDDRIEIDFQPTDSGGRMRIRLEEGFVRVFGRLIANAVNPQE